MKHVTMMEVAPTGCKLFFCLSGDEHYVTMALRHEYKMPEIKEIPVMNPAELCGCVEHNGSALVMIIHPETSIDTIVHESTHAAGFAWEQVHGDEEIVLSGEVLAYTVESVFRFAYDSFVALTEERRLESMVKKNPKGGWDVTSESGRKLGHHPTKKEADAQLRAIEAKKHKKGGKK